MFLEYTNNYPWLWAVYVLVLAVLVGFIGTCCLRLRRVSYNELFTNYKFFPQFRTTFLFVKNLCTPKILLFLRQGFTLFLMLKYYLLKCALPATTNINDYFEKEE